MEMDGSPDAKKHGNDIGAQDIKGTATVRARFPVNNISAITEQQRAHLKLICARSTKIRVGDI